MLRRVWGEDLIAPNVIARTNPCTVMVDGNLERVCEFLSDIWNQMFSSPIVVINAGMIATDGEGNSEVAASWYRVIPILKRANFVGPRNIVINVVFNDGSPFGFVLTIETELGQT